MNSWQQKELAQAILAKEVGYVRKAHPESPVAPRPTGRARALVRHRGDLPAAGASRGVGTDGVGQRRRHRAVVRGLDVGSGRAGLRPRGLHVLGFENTWEIESNWKVFQDNTIECYHCPTAHPEFSRAIVMDPRLHDLAVGGRYWIHHRIPFRDGAEPGITYGRRRPKALGTTSTTGSSRRRTCSTPVEASTSGPCRCSTSTASGSGVRRAKAVSMPTRRSVRTSTSARSGPAITRYRHRPARNAPAAERDAPHPLLPPHIDMMSGTDTEEVTTRART